MKKLGKKRRHKINTIEYYACGCTCNNLCVEYCSTYCNIIPDGLTPEYTEQSALENNAETDYTMIHS